MKVRVVQFFGCKWTAAGVVLLLGAFGISSSPAMSQTLEMTCRALPPLMGSLSEADLSAEQAFCEIDVSSASTAICSKTWSTSPAALIYDLRGTEWDGRATVFEQEICRGGGRARDKAKSELAIFKNSLNGRETSGTFAPASLLYYHFSRLLQTRLTVPVAVMVDFPAAPYRQRVVAPGLEDTGSRRTKMLHAGWQEMDLALADPAAYSHRRELFTADNERLWGIFLLQQGRRYGAEVNGTRASGWGDGQNRDFQKTPPFLALRTDLPLAAAITAGLEEAGNDPAMAEALSRGLAPAQIAWWMHEVTELVILDYILKQQDRIGNVDYRWRWHWLSSGELETSYSDPGRQDAVKLRVTALNDNDAGVRSGYANYASRTGMLENLYHLDVGLYQRLQNLAADLAAAGPVAQAVRNNYRLSRREAEGIVQRGIDVAAQLRARCESGALRFDLSVGNALQPDQAQELPAPCAVLGPAVDDDSES